MRSRVRFLTSILAGGVLFPFPASGQVSVAVPAAASAAAPAAFCGAYLGTVRLSLAQQPLYASMLLNDFNAHLQKVLPMPDPQAVMRYLESEASGGEPARASAAALRESLGRKPLPAGRAAALLLANALARPEQFRDILDGFEGLKPGLGKQVAKTLREADGKGLAHPDFVRLLRSLGDRVRPRGQGLTYDARGQLDGLFDGTLPAGDSAVFTPSEPVDAGGYTGYGPDGRPRRSGLRPRVP